MNKKILLTAGGTGGHFFPAMAFYEYLQDKGYDPILLTDKRCESYIAENLRFDVKIVDVVRLRKTPIGILKFLISLFFAYLTNVKLLLKERVEYVYSFGGYTSVATLLAAITCRKKIILSEQNIIPGRTNLLFSRFAKYIAFGFSDFSHVPENIKQKLVYTGIPVRKIGQKIQKEREFKITVIGGSQGAHIFSEIMPKILSGLGEDEQIKIELLQQARSEDLEQLEKSYKNMKFSQTIASFFKEANSHIAVSDLIIARAGASTIAELIAYKKFAILIPYKAAKDNHQFFNAKYVENLGLAKTFEEDQVEVEEIRRIIKQGLLGKMKVNLNQKLLDPCHELLLLAN